MLVDIKFYVKTKYNCVAQFLSLTDGIRKTEQALWPTMGVF